MSHKTSVTLQLARTAPHPCPYLNDQIAVTTFLAPEQAVDIHLFTLLQHNGFRRSGDHIYRPACPDCQACVPVRVAVGQFQPNRTQRRTLRNNADLQLRWTQPPLHDVHYQLFERYINQRHRDGDMYPASAEQFHNFLTAPWCSTRLLEFWQGERLLAVMVADQLLDGLSAVYSFFDPELAQRSLGTQAILSLIACCAREELAYVYLGYTIRNCRKMQYKTQFQPLERWTPQGWRPFTLAEK